MSANRVLERLGHPRTRGKRSKKRYFYQKGISGVLAIVFSGLLLLVIQPASATNCVVNSSESEGTVTLSITSGTNCNWTVPEGVTQISVVVVGGGGGGGNNFMNTFSETESGSVVGGGGGAGEVLFNPSLAVTSGETFLITIGSGGDGSPGLSVTTAAQNGTATVFGSFSAAGGGAGDTYSAGSNERFAAGSGGSGGGSINARIDATPTPRSIANTPSGWTSFGSTGQIATTETVQTDATKVVAGGGGGAKGVSGNGRQGVFIFGQCLATGGAGSVMITKWGSPRAISLVDHPTAVGCVDLLDQPQGVANSSVINVPPVANTGSGGAYFRTANSTAGMAGAAGVVLIRYTNPSFTASPTPTISGTAETGQTLAANEGTWTPTPSFTYQWKRGGVSIPGSTNQTYVLTADDLNQSITVEVTATRSGYTTLSRTSNAITPTAPPAPQVVQTQEPAPAPQVVQTQEPAPAPQVVQTQEPAATPEPASQTPSPSPTDTPQPSPSPTQTPQPSATPLPSPTATASPSVSPSEIEPTVTEGLTETESGVEEDSVSDVGLDAPSEESVSAAPLPEAESSGFLSNPLLSAVLAIGAAVAGGFGALVLVLRFYGLA